ncbi:unnamed protein product [Amoebophrya sp. A25]|nr:unnamed protein product [Amoebophrya sp. A25]|eukprot:GSA25T00016491001.1
MRYGKKLALHRNANRDRAPYINHKYLKTTIERMVQQLKRGKDVAQQDVLFFEAVEMDLARLNEYIGQKLLLLEETMSDLQTKGTACGFILTEDMVSALSERLQCERNDIDQIVDHLSRNSPDADCMVALANEVNAFLRQLNALTDFVEINCAGFRKLLKQRAKQFAALNYQAQTTNKRSLISYHTLCHPAHLSLIQAIHVYIPALEDFLKRKAAQGCSELEEQVNLIDCVMLGEECTAVLHMRDRLWPIVESGQSQVSCSDMESPRNPLSGVGAFQHASLESPTSKDGSQLFPGGAGAGAARFAGTYLSGRATQNFVTAGSSASGSASMATGFSQNYSNKGGHSHSAGAGTSQLVDCAEADSATGGGRSSTTAVEDQYLHLHSRATSSSSAAAANPTNGPPQTPARGGVSIHGTPESGSSSDSTALEHAVDSATSSNRINHDHQHEYAGYDKRNFGGVLHHRPPPSSSEDSYAQRNAAPFDRSKGKGKNPSALRQTEHARSSTTAVSRGSAQNCPTSAAAESFWTQNNAHDNCSETQHSRRWNAPPHAGRSRGNKNNNAPASSSMTTTSGAENNNFYSGYPTSSSGLVQNHITGYQHSRNEAQSFATSSRCSYHGYTNINKGGGKAQHHQLHDQRNTAATGNTRTTSTIPNLYTKTDNSNNFQMNSSPWMRNACGGKGQNNQCLPGGAPGRASSSASFRYDQYFPNSADQREPTTGGDSSSNSTNFAQPPPPPVLPTPPWPPRYPAPRPSDFGAETGNDIVPRALDLGSMLFEHLPAMAPQSKTTNQHRYENRLPLHNRGLHVEGDYHLRDPAAIDLDHATGYTSKAAVEAANVLQNASSRVHDQSSMLLFPAATTTSPPFSHSFAAPSAAGAAAALHFRAATSAAGLATYNQHPWDDHSSAQEVGRASNYLHHNDEPAHHDYEHTSCTNYNFNLFKNPANHSQDHHDAVIKNNASRSATDTGTRSSGIQAALPLTGCTGSSATAPSRGFGGRAAMPPPEMNLSAAYRHPHNVWGSFRAPPGAGLAPPF